MDSFSKRRPPKFSEPIDFNLKSSESYYSNLLVDRFNGLFSSGWSTNDQNGLFNFSNSLNSSGNGGVGESNNTRDSINNNSASNGVHGNNGGNNSGGGLYSSNLTHATNGINVNPFNTKGLMNSYDYNNQWIAPPRSCPPIGTRDSFNSFSITPRNNHANSNHSSKINNHQIISANNYYPLHSANNLNRDKFNNFNNNDFINGQQPLTRQNNNNSNNNTNNNSYVIGNNNNNNQTTMANNNNGYNNNLSLAANSNLNAQQASYVPPRVRRRNPSCTECVFCKNNGHPPSFYKGHILKCPEGKVICPVLREYDCPICHNGGGEKAHTLRYCPWNKPSFWQRANR